MKIRRQSKKRAGTACVEGLESRVMLSDTAATIHGHLVLDAYLNFKESGDEQIKFSGVTVFADRNLNGTLDAEEESAVTGDDGGFEMEVKPGAFRLRAMNLSGWSVG